MDPAKRTVPATGVLLIAHGSREADWAEPFEHVRARIAGRGIAVALAYLERMQPDMAGAAAQLVAEGCRRAIAASPFLGRGGHVLEDLPRLVAQTEVRVPGLDLGLVEAVGETAAVQDAIAEVAIAAAMRAGMAG